MFSWRKRPSAVCLRGVHDGSYGSVSTTQPYFDSVVWSYSALVASCVTAVVSAQPYVLA